MTAVAASLAVGVYFGQHAGLWVGFAAGAGGLLLFVVIAYFRARAVGSDPANWNAVASGNLPMRMRIEAFLLALLAPILGGYLVSLILM